MSKRISPERYVPVIKHLQSYGWTDSDIFKIMKVSMREIKAVREASKKSEQTDKRGMI